ncbi:MAG TPA: ATP-binding protein [Chitinophagaceae bacterium]
MKHILLPLFLFAFTAPWAQEHRLEKLWQTDTTIAVPESVLPDEKEKTLFVSLIDGGGWEADGKGGVGKLSPDGKTYNGSWITGLQAPKGMGRVAGRLYVADITEVVVVNIKQGAIEKRIAIDSALGLNDITVDAKGNVYVSDSRTARIWKIQNDHPTLYLENLKGVNGLKSVADDLIIASGRTFLKADAQKNLTTIAQLPQGGDGIEPIGNGDYLVTSWGGYIFYVSADGKVETLLETHQQKINTADIGYDPQKRIVYVPTFNGKSVVAYRLL